MFTDTVTVFAPATSANLNIGFDILGLALGGAGDIVTMKRISSPKVIIERIDGTQKYLPTNPIKNTASYPLIRMIEDLHLDFGFSFRLQKGIPLGSGLGGSAASAVASVVAANYLLPNKLSQSQMLKYILDGEERASKARHTDNILPCFFGGITLGNEDTVIQLPIPRSLCVVIWTPDCQVLTQESRNILPQQISLNSSVKQSFHLSAFVSYLYTEQLHKIRDIFVDEIIEPHRKSKIPNFDKAKLKAYEAGALGFGISGSGPSCFALCENSSIAKNVCEEVKKIFMERTNLQFVWKGSISNKGVHIITGKSNEVS